VGEVKIRDDSAQVNGIGGGLSNSIISRVRITHTKCGMWLDGPFDSLLITGVTIHDTTADGINFHDGVTNSVVEQSFIRNTGDDGLAMWSDQHADTNNTFRYNTVQVRCRLLCPTVLLRSLCIKRMHVAYSLSRVCFSSTNTFLQVPVLANCIAIYGGSDNSALGNVVSDSVTEGGGLHVGNRFNSVALSGRTTLANNEISRWYVCGEVPATFFAHLWAYLRRSAHRQALLILYFPACACTSCSGCLDPNWQFGVGAIWFYALDSPMSGAIVVNNTSISSSPYEAIHFIGSSVYNVAFVNVTVSNVSTFVFQVRDVSETFAVQCASCHVSDFAS
jgi:hypothetical protein